MAPNAAESASKWVCFMSQEALRSPMSPIRGRYLAQTAPVRQNAEPSARMHGRVRAHRYRLDVILCHGQDNRCVGMPPKADGARSRKSDVSLGVISAAPQRVELLGARRSQRKRPRCRGRLKPMVGDEGFAGRLAPPRPASGPAGPSRAAPAGGSRRPARLRALPGSNPRPGPSTNTAPSPGPPETYGGR